MTLDEIAHTLAARGWAVVTDFLDTTTVAALVADLSGAVDAGALRPAAVGRGQEQALRGDIRGDHILWLNEADATPAQQAYLRRMDALRAVINRTAFLGLFELESHFALYPPGTFYRKHLDRFRDDSARSVSCVLYLNLEWAPQDGGALRLYLDSTGVGDSVDIVPVAGTLVIFLADRFWHEVLPAQRARMSLTGWFRTRT
jgi:SM-20-related protein